MSSHSIPSFNVDIPGSAGNSLNGPLTRNTDTNVSATNYDALPPECHRHNQQSSQNNGFIDIHADNNANNTGSSHTRGHPVGQYDTSEFARELNVTPLASSARGLESQNAARFPTACTESPPGDSDSVAHGDQGTSASTERRPDRNPHLINTDAEPIPESRSSEEERFSAASRPIDTHWSAPGSGSKVQEVPYPAGRPGAVRPVDTHETIKIDGAHSLKVSSNGAEVKIDINNGGGAIQIGNNNRMVVCQQHSGGVNVVSISGTAQPKEKKKVKLEVDHRVVVAKDMDIISDYIGKDWRRLGSQLGLSNGDLDVLEHDHRHLGLREIIYQMMLKFLSNFGQDATIKRLTKALVAIKRLDVAKKFAKT